MAYLIMRCEEVFWRHRYPFTGRQTVIQYEGRALALTGVRIGGRRDNLKPFVARLDLNIG